MKYGLPAFVINDAGTAFRSKLFRDYLIANRVQQIEAYPHFQQANGLVERNIKTLQQIISKMITTEERNCWDTTLAEAVYALNRAVNRALGVSPHRALHGRDLQVRSLGNLVLEVDRDLDTIPIERNEAIKKLHASQTSMKNYYDKHRRLVTFQVGDIVAYKHNQNVSDDKSRKLLPCFSGYFEIVSVGHNKDEYELLRLDALGRELRSRTVHVSQIKRIPILNYDQLLFIKTDDNRRVPANSLPIEEVDSVVVENIPIREHSNENSATPQVLLRSKRLSPSHLSDSVEETIRPNPSLTDHSIQSIQSGQTQRAEPVKRTRFGRSIKLPRFLQEYEVDQI
jgi:hypothetical protein